MNPFRHQGRGSVRHGFTLIELIAVIVITAILAVVAVPAVSAISDARAWSGARVLVQHLSFAREQSLNLGNRTWIVFDVAANSYEVRAEPDGGAGLADALPLPDPATGRPLGEAFGAGQFAGVSLSAASFDGSATLGFDWLGAPLDAASGPLDADGVIRFSDGPVITIRAVTGDLDLDS